MSDAASLLAAIRAQPMPGQAAEAARLCRQLLSLDPNHIEALQRLGHALRALGRPTEALTILQRALRLAPTNAELHHQLGNLLKSLGRVTEAIVPLREAVRLSPADDAAWLNLGVALLESEKPAEAASAFRQAITLSPSRSDAHNILGVALQAAGHMAEARDALETALRLDPAFVAAHDNLGRLCKAEGRHPEAILHFRAALTLSPIPSTHSNLLLALNYCADIPPAEVFAEHRHWNALHAVTLTPATPLPAPSPARSGRRLRLGYVSPDFCHHAVAYFIEPVLASHNRDLVEVFCYSNVPRPDRFTQRLRTLPEHWRDISRLDDETAANLIRRDEIDLLIDLAGHTAHHRLAVFARRPAPTQATWIGYPNTTGLDAIDYRITDAISDPPGATESWHSEKLVRLPSVFSCYQPDTTAPAVAPPPGRVPGEVTFGSFNNFAKITPAVIALWARLLGELPSSRLFLKSRGLGDPSVAGHLRAAFASAGVAPERIALHGDPLSVPAHLGLYQHVDIGLDPFPYNGTTTTCEALWMGVPVLTLPGQVHAARVGASLLTHVGLTEWIASSPDDYVTKAVAAANNLPRLADLRRSLRERLRTSPLCDAVRFTRGFEEACLAMAARGI